MCLTDLVTAAVARIRQDDGNANAKDSRVKTKNFLTLVFDEESRKMFWFY